MEEAAGTEYFLARKTAEDYRKQGYDVSWDVPLDFLPGCRADLVARRDDQVKVIAIKTRAALAANPKIIELARTIDSKPGWSFELVLVAEPERLESPEGAESLERENILQRIEEAEAILASEHIESAFLLAWSAGEAAIRLLLADEGVPGAGITTAGHVLGQAVSLGVISRDEYRSLTRLQAYRNVIVHGYSHDDLGEKAARELIEIVRGLTAATV